MDEPVRRRPDSGAIVFGLILLVVGVYYLLERTLGVAMPALDWDKLWPLLLVALGVVVVFRAWQRQGQD